MYGGGAIPPKIGKLLYSAGVKLHSAYGATETGVSTVFSKRTKEDDATWDYMEFSQMTKVKWVPQGDGTYECQFKVNYLLVLLGFKHFIDGLIRRAIPMSWQLKIFLEDMQHQMCLLGILLKTTFGNRKLSSSFVSRNKLILFY